MAPLEGLKVFDLTSVVMGPYCTMLLSYLGADVIKLESLDGDITRSIGPMRHVGQTGLFHNANSGKRSIAIDLRDPRGRETCLDIARTSDVFIHSIRPDALQRLGLEYRDIATANPKIICCNLLGFGRKGRYFGKAAYDDTIQAASGLAMLQAEQQGEPGYVPSVFGDKMTGMMAAYAIVAAVIGRGRTGKGQEIDVPMFETMASCLLVEHASGATFKPPLGRPLYPRLVSRERRPVATKNGYLSIMVYTDKQWQGFCTVSGRTDLMADPRFKNITDRTRHTDEYYALVSEIVATRTAEEWESLLPPVGVPCMRLNRLDDLGADPHLQDVGFFEEVTDQWGELLQLPRFPVELSDTPALAPTAAPLLGQHSREILREAGYTDSRIDTLITSGVVRVSDVPEKTVHL